MNINHEQLSMHKIHKIPNLLKSLIQSVKYYFTSQFFSFYFGPNYWKPFWAYVNARLANYMVCTMDERGFLEFPDPWIFFLTYYAALPHWNLCFCSHEFSAILGLSISTFVVFRLCKEENSRIRKLKESVFIHCTDHVISQPNIDISPIWLPIIRPEINKKKLWSVNISRVNIDNNPRATRGLVVSIPD